MMEQKIVSREKLYTDRCDHHLESDDFILPSIEFELIEPVELNLSNATNEVSQNEFYFPLFSSGQTKISVDISSNSSLSEGNDTFTPLMKTNISEPGLEESRTLRPISYYTTIHTEEQKKEFVLAALDYDQIIEEAKKDSKAIALTSQMYRGRVIELNSHNRMLSIQNSKNFRIMRRRPGKKQRQSRKNGKVRENERKQKEEEIKKMIKKKFHRRGGKKNKKKLSVETVKRSVFRTE